MNKTRRRYLPNIQNRRLYSETLKQTIRVRIATNTIRTIEKRGGLDGFLLEARSSELPIDLARMKRRLQARKAEAAQD